MKTPLEAERRQEQIFQDMQIYDISGRRTYSEERFYAQTVKLCHR